MFSCCYQVRPLHPPPQFFVSDLEDSLHLETECGMAGRLQQFLEAVSLTKAFAEKHGGTSPHPSILDPLQEPITRLSLEGISQPMLLEHQD